MSWVAVACTAAGAAIAAKSGISDTRQGVAAAKPRPTNCAACGGPLGPNDDACAHCRVATPWARESSALDFRPGGVTAYRRTAYGHELATTKTPAHEVIVSPAPPVVDIDWNAWTKSEVFTPASGSDFSAGGGGDFSGGGASGDIDA